jgi:hypothetical protein
MANQIDLGLLLRNAAAYRNNVRAPSPLLAIQKPEEQDPNTISFQSPPFPTASSNAPSGLPPANVVPVVPAAPVAEPVAAETPLIPPPLPPVKSKEDQLKDILKGVGPDISTVTPHATKEEKRAVAERMNISDDKVTTAKERGELNVEKAKELAEQAIKEQAAAQEVAKVHAERQAAAAERVKQEEARLNNARTDYELNGTIKSMFGSDGRRAEANLLTGIGAFAAARGSGLPNLAAQNLKQMADEWHDMELSKVKQKLDLLNISRDEYQKAMTNESIELKNKEAAMLEVAAKERASILASHGAQEAQINTDEIINNLRDEKMQILQQNQEKLHSVTTASNATQQNIKQEIAKSKLDEALGKVPAGSKQSNETVSATNMINEGINAAEQLRDIVKKDPKAWDEYQAGAKKWQKLQKLEGPEANAVVRGGMALPRLAAGLFGKEIPTSEEQYMGSPEALKIHSLMTTLKTGIAKGFGGVITEGDKTTAGSRVAALANVDPSVSSEAFNEISKEFKNRRESYVKNTGVKVSLTDYEKKRKNAELMEKLRQNPRDPQVISELQELQRQ